MEIKEVYEQLEKDGGPGYLQKKKKAESLRDIFAFSVPSSGASRHLPPKEGLRGTRFARL